MKQQVLVIHGGTTFDTYKDYLSFLKKARVSLDDFASTATGKIIFKK